MRSRSLPVLMLLAVVALPAGVAAQVTLTNEGSVYAFENAQFRMEVDAAAGARIRSWVLKPSGRDLIALWKGADEIGGALDDRAFFTAARYDAAIMHPGPESATLRLEARHASGLGLVKTLSVARDAACVQVHYEFRNGTQAPQRLFVRSFFLPGAKTQGPEHLYWVNADPGGGRKPVEGAPDAGEYYRAAKPEVAALWHRETGDGIAAFVPGVDRFYFWRGSREFPTFEWIYADVPPGQVLSTGVLLAAVSAAKDAPEWRSLVAPHAGRVPSASLSPLAGWTDEATRFGVTDEERRRGIWLSAGSGEGKQRLPDPLPLDLPQDDDRYLAVTLNVLRDLQAPVRVVVPPEWREGVSVLWETVSPERREVLPPPTGAVAFQSGSQETLWLRVSSRGREPGQHRIALILTVGEISLPITLGLRVWPVAGAGPRPFHVRGYYSGLASLAGGYDMTEANLRRLDALLAAYREMGGNVLDWTCVWHEVVRRTKLAGTGESLAEVAKKTPERIDLERLPALDFSYFDPWFAACRRHGVTRLETYMDPLGGSRWQWVLIDPAIGKGRAKADTPEGHRVVVWFYREMRRYLEKQGFEGFFCKISDEISPEHIPSYVETARAAREAGWRPFTTVTGMVARTAEHIRALDPHCDQWQLAFGLKDDFLALSRKRFEVVEQVARLDGKWGAYGNGGAEATWGIRAFGGEGLIGIDPKTVESLDVLEDGAPLALSGGSPWGNKKRGIAFTGGSLGAWLYVSPSDGGDPGRRRYEVRVKIRKESERGQPLIAPDATDEVWCYGGGSNPFRGSYAAAYVYPAMAIYHRLQGYGQWAFYWWQKSERIVWVDEDGTRVSVSPAYCGYRDGWRDACLMHRWIGQRGREEYERITGDGNEKLLQVGFRSAEVYRFTTLLNSGDPVAMNAARRRALECLAERSSAWQRGKLKGRKGADPRMPEGKAPAEPAQQELRPPVLAIFRANSFALAGERLGIHRLDEVPGIPGLTTLAQFFGRAERGHRERNRVRPTGRLPCPAQEPAACRFTGRGPARRSGRASTWRAHPPRR